MRISDWSSDVCSSDLHVHPGADAVRDREDHAEAGGQRLDVAPEAFHRVLIALRHRLDAHGDDDDGEHDDGDRQHAEARYCEVHGSWFPLGWPAASPAPPADSRSGTGRRRLIYPLLRWWGKLWLRHPAVTGLWPKCGRCVKTG